MSDEPLYWDLDCGHYPGCKGKMRTTLDPDEVHFHPKCRSCRIKRQTHSVEPFCVHGNKLPNFTDDPPLACGCTEENNINEATWNWIPRE